MPDFMSNVLIYFASGFSTPLAGLCHVHCLLHLRPACCPSSQHLLDATLEKQPAGSSELLRQDQEMVRHDRPERRRVPFDGRPVGAKLLRLEGHLQKVPNYFQGSLPGFD